MLAEKQRSVQTIEIVTKAKVDGNLLGSYTARLRTDSSSSLLWMVVGKPTMDDAGKKVVTFKFGENEVSDYTPFTLVIAEYGLNNGGVKLLDNNERISVVFQHGKDYRIEDELISIIADLPDNKARYLKKAESVGETISI